ncbi:DUF3039 domain-containing protein [Pseudarthrobacter equi]|uniref:DUF3039 domain-containing protein n=1 Tax=Pseudarthrobacter equi TaxID=728066 RepID=UPI0021C4DF50|nr:DUF3039 domain-containing protein [Pseudarthrobacter equi]
MKTLTRPHAAQATRPAHDFNPTIHHYYKGSDLDWSAYSGEAVQALCGDRGRPSESATGQPSNSVLVVCPLCSMAYDNLPRPRKK